MEKHRHGRKVEPTSEAERRARQKCRTMVEIRQQCSETKVRLRQQNICIEARH